MLPLGALLCACSRRTVEATPQPVDASDAAPEALMFFVPRERARAMDAPDAGGYWTPSQVDVESVAGVLRESLAADPDGPYIIANLPSSRAQLVGIVSHGERRILANYVCKRSFDTGVLAANDMRTHWIRVYDGGPCFFHFTYDPGTKKVYDMIINGG